MSAVVRIQDYRRQPPFLHFTRSELNRLLGLYASRVIKGEWRDYAISLGPEAARFMIFSRSQEYPQFVISKLEARADFKSADFKSAEHRSAEARPDAKARARAGRYVVTSRQCKLRQGNSLDDVLAVFERSVALIRG